MRGAGNTSCRTSDRPVLRALLTACALGAWSLGFGRADAAGFDFADVTAGPLGDTGVGEGIVWGDWDGDGDHDLYLAKKEAANRLLRNDGSAGFADVTSGPIGDAGDGEGIAWGDHDNDGDLDLYLANTFATPNRLFRNDGGGAFADVTTGALGDTTNSESVAWADFDNDGDLDLYLCNFGRNKLFRNDGQGSFRNRALAAGVAGQAASRGVAWGDFDDDGDLDLYVTNELVESKLYRNDGAETFTDVTVPPVGSVGSAQSVAWADYDDDGDLDLYVGSRNSANTLLRNDGGSFVNATPPLLADSGATYGIAWGDLDLDGDLDLYVVNDGPNLLARNDGNGQFADVTAPPLDDADNGRGAAWADYDGDGDLDLYLVIMNGANRLFRNDLTSSNHWLQLDLVGVVSNRSAIGTRVRVVAGGANRVLEISGGDGYHTQNSLTAEFGLGASAVADSVIVRWPSGIVQALPSVPGDQRITVTENDPAIAVPAHRPAAPFRILAAPNPFSRATRLTFGGVGAEGSPGDDATRGPGVLRFVDVHGRTIRELSIAADRTGSGSVTWDGRDTRGGPAPSGVYWVLFRDGERSASRRVVLIRR